MGPHAGMLLWALIVGASFPAIGHLSDGLPPLLLTALRFAIAACAVAPLVRGAAGWRPAPAALALYAAMGLCLAGLFGIMFWAAHRVTALSMSALFVSMPVLAYGLGRMLGVEARAGGLPAILGLGAAGALALALAQTGGTLAGLRFGGNEVITSLMMNYMAILLVQYLVSGPLRAAGDLPVSPRLPQETWLPYLFSGSRAHLGIVIALLASFVVWLLLIRSRIGYELIVTGLNPKAARYGGINVGSRQLLASFLAGGLAAMAGMVDILGVHHRLVDGMAEGTGFIGIVVALLGKLSPAGCVVAGLLYAGLTVGADAMQRQAGLPASVIFIVQSLIILFVLASDVLRFYSLGRPARQDALPVNASS